MSKVLGVIPARYGSTRFPGKVLAKIGSWPMIRYVYEAAKQASVLDHLVVATDDERVGECLMTSENHKSGTDRLAEVADYYKDYDILVNIQGDEPGIEPALIDGVARLKIENPAWEMATAARPFTPNEDPLQPNRVKVVMSRRGRALYFSRSLIPFPRNKTDMAVHLHLGIYAYQRDFLMRFHTLPNSGLEDTESLEQLRALENDHSIGVFITETSMPGVDTPEDLNAISGLFKGKGLIR
jgi:3-deoxy-manno-octulosonate cytidylyltransferase (CMP-KDO synthetase)